MPDTELLKAWRELLDQAGFKTDWLERNDQRPYDAILLHVPGGEGAGVCAVHINLMPIQGDTQGSGLAQIIAQLPQTIVEGQEGSTLVVCNHVNRRILMGHFMTGPGGTLFFRHTFYVNHRTSMELKVLMMDQRIGLMLHTLQRMWEPLGRIATKQVSVREAIGIVEHNMQG